MADLRGLSPRNGHSIDYGVVERRAILELSSILQETIELTDSNYGFLENYKQEMVDVLLLFREINNNAIQNPENQKTEVLK
jgi:hypothetical protein